MTREEAIGLIKDHIDTYVVCHGEEDAVAVSIDNVDVEAFDMAIKALEQEPKIGHWIEEYIGCMYDVCSECGQKVTTGHFKYNFCPNCGCAMKGESE